jgi:ribosomal-protein-alanine N-acetyltransferase
MTRLNGKAIYLRFLEPQDAAAVLSLYKLNRAFLTPWEPKRSDNFYSLQAQRESIESMQAARQVDQGYGFGIFLKETGELVGRVNLSGVVRGVFQNANIGYLLAEQYNGHGYMSEAVNLVLRYAFKELGLHRVQAGTMLNNYGSMRVLQKCGFRHEGVARRYLKINGNWEDHNIFAITAEEFEK